ncbi:MAG: hypothetical protein E3J66_05550 [Dehalococcoidia bacterium]|nr:MAG: hypothetical protein E3J66_05550 [Dehalococcoidia bacterium]
MAKGRPKINREVAEFINLAVTQHPDWTAGDILRTVKNKFESKGIPIPKLRTVQQYIKVFRKKLEEEEFWSLAAMEANKDIPWEAVPFLLECSIELTGRAKQGEQLWPWTERLPGDLKKLGLEVRQSASQKETVLTYRQAKWLWRIHLAMPTWTLPKWLPELCERADEYAHREMMADYLGYPFDTSDLDGSLRNLLRDIKHRGISAKKDMKQKQKTGKEE